MFRYGGPIKEGVMHGMKDGGRIGFEFGGSGWHIPTASAAGTATTIAAANQLKKKIATDVAKKTAQTFGQGLYGQGTLSIPNWLKRLGGWMKPGYKTGLLSRWGIGTLPASYIIGSLALQKSLPKHLKGKGGIYETAGYADPMSAGADVSYDIPEVSNIPGEKLKPIVTEDDKWHPGVGGKQKIRERKKL